MDKAEFIERAPIYYAIAIVQFLAEQNAVEARSLEILDRYNRYEGTDERPSLPFPPFFNRAVTWLVRERVLEVLNDDFAPQVLIRSDSFEAELDRISDDSTSPFNTYRRVRETLPWLFGALDRLETTRLALGVDEDDLEIDEWAPLELDRSESELMAVIESVDDVVEKVRGVNGYADNMPQERAFTLESLTAFSQTLKESAATSASYIRRFAIEPIGILSRRFAKGTIELTIAAAKEALKAWLKKHELDWLEEWWK
jgi:hypothetical protein